MRRSSLLVPLLCFALSALVAVPAASAAPPLVGQWPLNASVTSGGSDLTEDTSGNGLTLSSPANTMKFGTAEGKFGGYLSNLTTTPLQVNSPLLAQQQLTLLAWIKQNGYPGTLRYIAGRGNDGPTCSGSSYALYSGYAGIEGLHFYIRQPGPGAISALSDTPPSSAVYDNKWHLVAGTFDGSAIHLYVDGKEVGTPKPASGISYEAPITDPNFYVDGYPPQAGCIGASDFPGQIDEVRVYDRALSPAELTRLAAAPGPVPPVLEPDAGAQPGPGPVSPQPEIIGPTPTKVGVTLSRSGGLTTASTSRMTVFKLNTSGPVSQTTIKLDGKPVFNVPPSTATVGLNLGKVGDHLISATSFGAGGTSASASTKLTVTPSPSTGGSLSRPKFLPDTGFFTPAEESTSLLEALKNSQCVPDSTVVFGVMEAHGCFRKILPTPEELPRGEKGAAEEYLQTQILLEGYTVRPCRMEDPTCHTDYSKAFQKDPALQPFVSADDVHINGMTIEPIGSATVLVFPAIKRVISSNAKIYFDGGALGKFPVRPTGPVNLDLSTNAKYFTSGDAEVNLFSFDTSQAFDDIGGFPINGTVGIAFERRSGHYLSSLKVNLSLPEEITTAAGANPTARVEVGADNARGTYLDLLNIHLGEAFLGPVELANVDFTYNDGGNADQECPRKWWKATAEVFFVPVETGQQGAGLKMAPEPQRNGIAFCAGEFHSAGAALKFGYPFLPPPVLFPGVTLNEIGFSFQLHKPVIIDGYATIHAAEIVNATGGFLAAFATPDHPYTFKPGDAGGTLREIQGQTVSSTTFAVGGTVNIEPGEGVGMELGNAHLIYSYPGFLGAGGTAHLNTYLFVVNAGGSLELNTVTRRFNAEVHGEICLLGGIKVAHVGACAGGEGHISSRGISVCFDILDGTWTPGVGYLYGQTVPTFFAGALGDGCKPSQFWEVNVRGARASALNEPVVFRVEPGEKAKTVELTGAGGAPAVTVIGPDGERLASEANTMLHGKKLSAISAARFDRTWIGVEDGKPGVYKVIPADGSAAIVDVQETRYEPEAGVEASVTGGGRHFVLHYDAGHAAGQTVSFYERGKDTWELLKTVKGGKGRLVFEPALGSAGRRSIAAQVEVDGIPGPLETLDHFKAPPPPRVGRVKGVHVIRHGGGLAVSWRKAPYAQGYSVVTEASGGAVHTLRVKAKRHTVTVKGVPATEAGSVEVVAFGPTGDRAKPSRAKFEALREPKTRMLPFDELGSGEAAGHTKTAKKGKRARS